MRTLSATLCAVVLVLSTGCNDQSLTSPLAASGAAAHAAMPASQCQNVRGDGVMNIFNFAQPITLSGDLTGVTFPALGSAQFTPHGAGGAMHVLFDGDLWVTNAGTFTTRANVAFAPSDPPVLRWNGRFEITSGGTGFLVQQGTLNQATGEGSLTYHGRICL